MFRALIIAYLSFGGLFALHADASCNNLFSPKQIMELSTFEARSTFEFAGYSVTRVRSLSEVELVAYANQWLAFETSSRGYLPGTLPQESVIDDYLQLEASRQYTDVYRNIASKIVSAVDQIKSEPKQSPLFAMMNNTEGNLYKSFLGSLIIHELTWRRMSQSHALFPVVKRVEQVLNARLKI